MDTISKQTYGVRLKMIFASAILLIVLAAQSGCEQDPLESLKLEANKGNVNAMFDIARAYDLGEGVQQDYKLAMEWYRKAAEKGHADAMFHIGMFYQSGCCGIPRDHKQALEWYRKAAEKGHARAMFGMGLIYGLDKGVPQDWKQAAEWIRKAAEKGVVEAMGTIGGAYLNGRGVPQDDKQAYVWLSVAVAFGDKRAGEHRDKARGSLTPEQIAEGQRLSQDIIERIKSNEGAK